MNIPTFLRAFIIYLYFSLWCCSGALFFIVAAVGSLLASAKNEFFSGIVQSNIANTLSSRLQLFPAEMWQTS